MKKRAILTIIQLILLLAILVISPAKADDERNYRSNVTREGNAAASIWFAPTPQPYAQPYKESVRGLDRPTDWQRVLPQTPDRTYEPDNRRWEPRAWNAR